MVYYKHTFNHSEPMFCLTTNVVSQLILKFPYPCKVPRKKQFWFNFNNASLQKDLDLPRPTPMLFRPPQFLVLTSFLRRKSKWCYTLRKGYGWSEYQSENSSWQPVRGLCVLFYSRASACVCACVRVCLLKCACVVPAPHLQSGWSRVRSGF